MSKIHIRSYLDPGAPQFDGLDRRAFIKFFRENFEKTPYITQLPNSLVVDRNSKTIQLSFPSPPLFIIGHLVALTNTTDTVFQSTNYRVIDVQNNNVILRIDNYDSVTYPSGDTGLSIKAQLAPLNWEICWADTNKFSMRSKNVTSSKNVFTIHTPSFKAATVEPSNGVTNLKYATASTVRISRDIDKTNGSLVDDLTQTAHNMYTGDTTTKETLYFVWNCSDYSYGNAYSGNIPWFLVADDKFFYIIIGSYGSSSGPNESNRNFSRQQNYGVTRNTYFFGDPDFLGDPSIIDKDGTVLQTSYSTNWDTSMNFYQSRFTERFNYAITPSSKASGCIYFARDFDTVLGSGIANDLTTASLLTMSNFQSYSGGNSSFGYPNKITNGILTFPVYLSKAVDGGATSKGSYVRSILPFTLFCHTNLTNLVSSNWALVDYNLFKLYDGRLIMPIVVVAGTYSVSQVALFELD